MTQITLARAAELNCTIVTPFEVQGRHRDIENEANLKLFIAAVGSFQQAERAKATAATYTATDGKTDPLGAKRKTQEAHSKWSKALKELAEARKTTNLNAAYRPHYQVTRWV